MTVPALPADMSTGDTWTATRVNGIYDLLEWFRESRPMFVDLAGHTSQLIPSGTETEYEWSDGAGSFLQPITRNRGGWTAGTSGAVGIICPEDGYYQISHGAVIAAPTASTTWVQGRLKRNGAEQAMRWGIHESQANLGEELMPYASGLNYFAEGDEVTIAFEHNNGSDLSIRPHLSMLWVGT